MKKDKSESVDEPKKLKLVTASQAFNAIGGNSRLKTYVRKKYQGDKSLDQWVSLFEKDNVK